MKNYMILYYSSVRNEWIVIGETNNKEDALRDYEVAKGMYLKVRMIQFTTQWEYDGETP